MWKEHQAHLTCLQLLLRYWASLLWPKPYFLLARTLPLEWSQLTAEWGTVSSGSLLFKTSRHSPSHLHQDTLLAGLEWDLITTHTREAGSFSPAVGFRFPHISLTLFPDRDLILGKIVACQSAYVKMGTVSLALMLFRAWHAAQGCSWAATTCCRVILWTALPHLHSNPLRQLEPFIPVSLVTDRPVVAGFMKVKPS